MIALILAAVAQVAGAASPASAPPPVMHKPAAATTGADTCLPLRFADSMPIIEASIGVRKLWMAFDTGAPGFPHLSQAVVDEMKLPKVGEVRASDPSGKNSIVVPVHELDGLRVGNLSVGKWTVSARPTQVSRRIAEPDGIMGLTAFEGYVVTIDYPGNRMLLTKGRLPEADGKTSFNYEGAIPRVPLSIEGQEIDAHLDTGNSRYPLILPEGYASRLPGYSGRYPIGVARTINNSFNLMALPIRNAKMGEIALHAGTAAYPGPTPASGNIGSLLLKDFIVKVDPANRIVTLERAKPGLESGCPNT